MPQTTKTTVARLRILQVPDCPLVDTLVRRLETCLAALGRTEQVEVVIGDHPSPTLLVDGIDVTTGEPVAGAPRCRFDLPTEQQIKNALAGL